MDKKSPRGERLRHTIVILAIVIFAIICGLKFAERYINQRKYEDMTQTATAASSATVKAETETARETVKETETAPQDPEMEKKIDFTSLLARNSDVVGWLYIPGTMINYPILWKQGDNDYYLHRDIDRNRSYEGVFLDGDCRPDWSAKQNLIYGHHMKNGTMFAGLAKFKEQPYFNEHRFLYLYTPDKTYKLKTMACEYTDARAEKRRTVFADRTEFDAYVDKMTRDCTFREIPTGGIRQLFSLVTCSYEYNNARTILYAYEVDAAGNPVPPESTAAESSTGSTGSTAAKSTEAGSNP